eukprot:717173-Pelagomonas_calceolata.AAC.2
MDDPHFTDDTTKPSGFVEVVAARYIRRSALPAQFLHHPQFLCGGHPQGHALVLQSFQYRNVFLRTDCMKHWCRARRVASEGSLHQGGIGRVAFKEWHQRGPITRVALVGWHPYCGVRGVPPPGWHQQGWHWRDGITKVASLGGVPGLASPVCALTTGLQGFFMLWVVSLSLPMAACCCKGRECLLLGSIRKDYRTRGLRRMHEKR